MVILTVLHNNEKDSQGRHIGAMDGYQKGHSLEKVYAAKFENSSNDLELCDILYHVTNAPNHFLKDGQKPLAADYHKKAGRGINIGDVIVIGEKKYSCESVGWKEIEESQETETQEKIELNGGEKMALERAAREKNSEVSNQDLIKNIGERVLVIRDRDYRYTHYLRKVNGVVVCRSLDLNKEGGPEYEIDSAESFSSYYSEKGYYGILDDFGYYRPE